MNSLDRRLARLEEAARTRAAGDDADDAELADLIGAEVVADLRAGRIDPVSLLPPELVAYLHHGPHAPPLSPEMRAGLDLWLAEYEAKRHGGRAL